MLLRGYGNLRPGPASEQLGVTGPFPIWMATGWIHANCCSVTLQTVPQFQSFLENLVPSVVMATVVALAMTRLAASQYLLCSMWSTLLASWAQAFALKVFAKAPSRYRLRPSLPTACRKSGSTPPAPSCLHKHSKSVGSGGFKVSRCLSSSAATPTKILARTQSNYTEIMRGSMCRGAGLKDHMCANSRIVGCSSAQGPSV